ncbi:MAG: prepilin-type N-terminal cleavage/methylation domain-containing protein [Rhodocyclaceae bacterium]|nr:prepilin-type N-terminal cleavage/methylation domain-containing protein [Rhodocyclaceae bacterium]
MRQQQRGFTLIEIAIVLVIIGLLLGGVLKGQELINQAKIKNIANDMNGVSVAVYAYQDRYKRLPGDDNGAETRWGNTVAKNGDSNNVIGTAGTGYNATAADSENRQFWAHLRLSGLITGDTSTKAGAEAQPINAAGGIMGVQVNGLSLKGLVVCTGSLPGKIAQAVDAKFDDGSAATGNVRGMKEGTAPTDVPTDLASTTQTYVDDGSIYVICKNVF